MPGITGAGCVETSGTKQRVPDLFSYFINDRCVLFICLLILKHVGRKSFIVLRRTKTKKAKKGRVNFIIQPAPFPSLSPLLLGFSPILPDAGIYSRQGMIGTVDTLLAGAPSINLRLTATYTSVLRLASNSRVTRVSLNKIDVSSLNAVS